MNLLTKSLPMRMRKLIGTVILLVFIPAYALMAMAVTGGPGVINANKWIQMLCYIVAGTLWAFPAGMLIRWMQRDDAPTG
jgi:peptidoglycan/LPS O-acetylase OafA/YrhL